MCLATLKLQAAAWVVRSGRCISSSNMEDAGSFYPGQNTRGFWRPGSWFTAWEPSSSLSLFACRRQRAIGRLTWTARLHLSIYQYAYICVERERHWETPRWPSFTSLASSKKWSTTYLYVIFFTPKVGCWMVVLGGHTCSWRTASSLFLASHGRQAKGVHYGLSQKINRNKIH